MINKVKTYDLRSYLYSKDRTCLKCGNFMEVSQKTNIVKVNSEEYKKYRYKFIDLQPVGEIQFIDDVLICKKCNFEISVVSYYRLIKMINRMEKRDKRFICEKKVSYLYEKEIEYAFSKILFCNKCNHRLKLNYEVLTNPEMNDIFFESFNQKSKKNDVEQYRKLYFECCYCNEKIGLAELAESEKVSFKKNMKTIEILFQILIFIIIICVYFLVKK